MFVTDEFNEIGFSSTYLLDFYVLGNVMYVCVVVSMYVFISVNKCKQRKIV